MVGGLLLATNNGGCPPVSSKQRISVVYGWMGGWQIRAHLLAKKVTFGHPLRGRQQITWVFSTLLLILCQLLLRYQVMEFPRYCQVDQMRPLLIVGGQLKLFRICGWENKWWSPVTLGVKVNCVQNPITTWRQCWEVEALGRIVYIVIFPDKCIPRTYASKCRLMFQTWLVHLFLY